MKVHEGAVAERLLARGAAGVHWLAWTRIEYLDVVPHESQQQRLMRKDMEGSASHHVVKSVIHKRAWGSLHEHAWEGAAPCLVG